MLVRAVISGATGAIGMALVELLEVSEIETLVLCRADSKRIARIKESKYIRVAECSLDQMKSFSLENDKKYDVFFHFAWAGTWGEARSDLYLQNENVRYTLDAVELAARLGCKKFIGAGSQAEYGRYEGIISPKTPAYPENGYGIAKLCAGQLSREQASKHKMDHIWVRILSVFGPYDSDKTMVMSAVRKLLAGEIPSFTPAEQLWDYIYSKDAARAFLALAENGKSGEVYCLGSGCSVPLCEYVYKIRDAIDKDAPLGIGDVPYADRQVMHLQADISKLTQHTGFAPRYSFEEGIKETVAWAKANPS